MLELSAGAWKLFCFLARCRNQSSGKCCPSVATSADAIGVHQKNIFKLRKELAAAGWAVFEGNTAQLLKGFHSSKNTTIGIALEEDTEISSKNTTNSPESQKHYPMVVKTLPDGSKNTTPYKEEPAKEPAKEPERERAKDIDLESAQIKAFVKAYPNQPATIHLAETLAAVTDIEAWGEVLKFWKTNRYSVRNLSGMLDRYNAELAKKAKNKSYDGFWNRCKKPTGANPEPVPAVAPEIKPSKPAVATGARGGSHGRMGRSAEADQGRRPAPPVSLRTRFPREAPIWKTINAGRSAVRVEQAEERDDLELLFGPMGASEQ
jgi:hypothetical protein